MSRIRFLGTGALLLGAFLATGLGLAASPLLAAGAVLGAAVIAATLAWPLAVVGVMLALGPIDLAVLTGGVRGLLPALGGLDMSGIRLIAISAGLGTVVLTRRDLLGRLLAPESRWYVLFLVWAGASLALSPDPLEGLRLLLKLTYPLLVFLVVAAPDRTPDQLRRLADWALWGATTILLFNPFVVANGGYAVEAGTLTRLSGPGSHFNPFSFYLLAVLLLCVARFRTRGQARYLILGAAAVVWMALTLTRITFLAALVATGVAALYAAIVDRSPKALIAMGSLAAIIGALAMRGVLERTFGYVPTAGQLVALLSDPVGLYQSMNWQGRETLWGILWVAFASSPVIGSGMGASRAALLATQGEAAAHNEYLRLAVDVGLVGCTLFFLAMLGWIRAVVRAVRSGPRTNGAEEFTLPALAGLAAWAVISTTDNAFDYYGPFTQYVAVLVAGSVVLGRAPAEVDAPEEDAAPEVSEEPVPLRA